MNTKKLWLGGFMIFLLSGGRIDAKTLTIVGDQLNVRSGPGRTYDVVEVVNKNEKFEILEEKDSWYKISVEGKVGWVSAKAVEITVSKDIQEMLKRADQYFGRQQFTTPSEANAFDIYQEVLRKDPGNSHALKKIKQIASIYKTWADRAYQRGEYDKAKTFYQRYLFVVPDDQRVRELLAQSRNPELNPGAVLKVVSLRADPTTVSEDFVARMIRKYGFNHPADWSKYGVSASITGSFEHEYESKQSYGVQVIIDYATNLMWQQAGTPNPITWKSAHEYSSKLNSEQYAGYSDWRLPTIEELASLVAPSEQNGNLYIAPVFETVQVWCWSADKVASSHKAAWYVSFSSGGIQQHKIETPLFVRAVRTLSTQNQM